jgi:hypothetical protein
MSLDNPFMGKNRKYCNTDLTVGPLFEAMRSLELERGLAMLPPNPKSGCPALLAFFARGRGF